MNCCNDQVRRKAQQAGAVVIAALVVIGLSYNSLAIAADNSGVLTFLLFQNSVAINDDVEHGSCPGPYWSIKSCPVQNLLSQVTASTIVSHSGSYSYRLPAPPLPNTPYDGTLISSGKLETGFTQLYAIEHEESTVRYSAYYYIASGFDDTTGNGAWHIQMQWKMVNPERPVADRYWGSQNPKIALGFHNIAYGGIPVRQVQVTVRDSVPGLCVWSYDKFRSDNTLGLPPIPVPTGTWVQIIVEIHFSATNGYIRVWQGDNPPIKVIDKTGINTMTQLVTSTYAKPGSKQCSPTSPYYWSFTSSFDFGVDNYISMLSYDPAVRPKGSTSQHLLYVDDILVRGE